jgi:mono/diheme cytochrome c family protein
VPVPTPIAAATAALVTAAVLAIAACGGTAAKAPSGRAVFATACHSCHTLSGPGAPATQGGDLRELRIERPQLLQFVREMPVRRRLSAAELRAVADYLLGVQRRARQAHAPAT